MKSLQILKTLFLLGN